MWIAINPSRIALRRSSRKDAQIDVLVNNAGIERHGSVEELPMEDFRATMETNYFGALRCIRQVLPGMRERGSGCIINVTSVAGKIALFPAGGLYGIEIRAGGRKRSAGAGNETVRSASCDCGAGYHRYLDGPRDQEWATIAVPSGKAAGRVVSSVAASILRRRPLSPASSETSSKAARGNCVIRQDPMPNHFWAGGRR